MSPGVQSIIMLVLMFAIFYFLLIRPQQKRQKSVQQMQSSLEKGDKVVTIGGLHGFIDAIDEGTVVIRCGDGSKLTYERSAIRDVVEKAAK
ncbi:preprotein translocase subunit YajC [Caldibacillus lycopersici]|uniref:Preprotein translocase subunit YajC n=1 Tax=Perspicuibacillus lycopersici TaxID=1325689 RepID=A0AAE3LNL3_9BACI|nr:preprotein translocase subunit YajC [Perspicuibacillus lycopersici]MCU9613991.1 preprotein translocase subunit YajC [Perspicuibacillus lycopersici]